MPIPESVTKVYKSGHVVFTSKVDRANYLISELTRAAMKDVGKTITKLVRKKVSGISDNLKNMKYAYSRYQYWVRKRENDLQLGIENTSKGAVSAWWADQAELGTSKQPKRGLLRSTVYDNIDLIRKIEAQYLSAIEDEIRAQSLVDEDENDPAAD